MIYFLYKISLIFAFLGLSTLIVAMRLGGVVPEDFVNSKIPISELSSNSWQIYSSKEWYRLGIKLIEQKQNDDAKNAFLLSLTTDVSNALTVAALAKIYEKEGDIQKASVLFHHARMLWPAKFHQLQNQHIQQQARINLRKQLAQLKKQIKDKQVLNEKIIILKNNHEKRLQHHQKKLLKETLNAYQ